MGPYLIYNLVKLQQNKCNIISTHTKWIMSETLTKKEKLIASLLFADKYIYDINIEEYCNIDARSDFREEIRNAIKRGGITIVEDRIIHKEEKIIWKIEIKK
jgi:hypothetical protein